VLRAIYNFFASVRQQKMQAQPDYYAELSRRCDNYKNDELVATIPQEKPVSIKDVKRIYDSVRRRSEYRCSNNDYNTYVAPVFYDLISKVQRLEMECHVNTYETVTEGGIVRAGDLLSLIEGHDLPDGGDKVVAHSVESVPVPVENVFDKGALGEFQKKMNEKYPLRTPSTEVFYEKIKTDVLLNLKRGMIIAVGFADSQEDFIKEERIPTFRETRMQRNILRQNRRSGRMYRGNKY
jgi:hypothetical protein